MAKAINWPAQFREDVLKEDTERVYCAFRLGTIYYDNQYWAPDEVVDIRVNHLKVRKGQVVGELKKCTVAELTPDDFLAQKPALRSVEAVVDYLHRQYQQPVSLDTVITVVYYRNLPINPDDIEQPDDPHL